VAPSEGCADGLVDKLHTQKGITITQKTLPGANHFFNGQVETLMAECEDYLDRRLDGELVPEPAAQADPVSSKPDGADQSAPSAFKGSSTLDGCPANQMVSRSWRASDEMTTPSVSQAVATAATGKAAS
jgi:hypothetical protein